MIHLVRKSTNLNLKKKKKFVVSGSSLHELETYYGCVFVDLRIKKKGEMTQKSQK